MQVGFGLRKNGQLTFYEFAKRAVPPDYKGKGKLYRLTGGNDDSDDDKEEDVGENQTQLKPTMNMKVHNSDIQHYIKSRNILSTPLSNINIPHLYWPKEQPGTSYPLTRRGNVSMPNIHHLNRNGSRQSTSRREMLNSRASKIHSSQSLRYYKNNKRRGGGNSHNNNELSNSEKNLLLQEYKSERYLKKIKT